VTSLGDIGDIALIEPPFALPLGPRPIAPAPPVAPMMCPSGGGLESSGGLGVTVGNIGAASAQSGRGGGDWSNCDIAAR
jgi:hypothetical protein